MASGSSGAFKDVADLAEHDLLTDSGSFAVERHRGRAGALVVDVPVHKTRHFPVDLASRHFGKPHDGLVFGIVQRVHQLGRIAFGLKYIQLPTRDESVEYSADLRSIQRAARNADGRIRGVFVKEGAV